MPVEHSLAPSTRTGRHSTQGMALNRKGANLALAAATAAVRPVMLLKNMMLKLGSAISAAKNTSYADA